MLFRLRPEDFNPEEHAPPPRTPPPAPARLCDLSPEEWGVVHMMLADHRLYGEVLAQGQGTAASHARRMATSGKRGR
jgi:hypothetical protein